MAQNSNTYNTNHHEDHDEEFEDTLSLCDLSLEDYQDDPSSPNSPTYSDNSDLFEFPNFTTTTTPSTNPFINTQNDVVFCGKLIKEQDYPLSSFRLFDSNKRNLGSLHFADSKPNASAKSSSKSHGFVSSPSRKQGRVFIGLAKLPSKMELSDIKKRQSRRVPSPMFPPAAKDMEVMTVADGCGSGGGKGHQHWGMLKPLRSRGHLVNALVKVGLRCISHV